MLRAMIVIIALGMFATTLIGCRAEVDPDRRRISTPDYFVR
jgi:hypothetical protein